MAEIIEESNHDLQDKIDALNDQIKHLEQVIEKNAESAQNISEQIAKNKDEEKAIFSKYEDTIQKVFGENHKKTANAERIGDLTDIAKSISKDIKANAGKVSTAELEVQLAEVRKDIERVRAIRSETRQLNSEKKSATTAIDESNSELTRFREALRSITLSNNSHLASIDASNQSIDKSNANIDTNVETISEVIPNISQSTTNISEKSGSIDGKLDELAKITQKLEDIYDAMPDFSEAEKPDNNDNDDDHDDGDDIERDYDDDYEDRIEALEKEAETVDEIKDAFEELIDVIESKNESLEDENNLLDEEEEKLEGAISKFKDIHKEAEDITDEFEDGQKALTKAKSTNASSGSGGFWSFLSSVLDTIYSLTIGLNDKWNEIDDHAHKYGRTLGMTAQQMRSYQKMLMSNDITDLMGKYHMLGSEINALQSGFTEASNSAKILAVDELDAMAATSKYVGADTALAVAESMREIGGSIIDSQAYLATTMERARANGLNMAKHSKNFADNIKLASKYNFKQGLSDISKMTALTDRWQVNLGAFAEGLSTSFKSVESSIETSAKLQVLGGPMAAMFGNPLEMMNMAKTDMAGMIDRFKDAIKDAGTFDVKTGIVQISNFQKEILQAQAEALHLNYDDMIKAVTAEEKARAIDAETRAQGLGDAQKEWLRNMAQFKDGKWVVTTLDKDGHAIDTAVSDIKNGKQLDILRQTQATEEVLQGDVHAIRMKLLGERKEESSQDAISSYFEHRDSLNERVQTIGARAIDELEQEKVGLIYWIEDGVTKIVTYVEKTFNFFKECATTWNGWMTKVGESLPWLKKVTDALSFQNTSTAGNVMAGGAVLVAGGAVLHAVRHSINTVSSLYKGGKSVVNGARGGASWASTKVTESHLKKVQKDGMKAAERGDNAAFEKALEKEAKLQNKLKIKNETQALAKAEKAASKAAPKGKFKLGKKGKWALAGTLLAAGMMYSSSANAAENENPEYIPEVEGSNGGKPVYDEDPILNELKIQTELLSKIARGYESFGNNQNLLIPEEKEVNTPFYQSEYDPEHSTSYMINEGVKGMIGYQTQMKLAKKLGNSTLGKLTTKAGNKLATSSLQKLGVKSLAKSGGGLGAAGIAADMVNMGGQYAGWWDEGSAADKGLSIASRTGQYASIGSMIPGIGTAIGAGIGFLYGVAEQFEGDMNNFANDQLQNGNLIVGEATKIASTSLRAVKDTFDTFENVIGDVVGGIYDGVVDGGKQILEGNWEEGLTTLCKDFSKGVVSAVGDVVKGAWKLVTGVTEGAISMVGGLFGYQGKESREREAYGMQQEMYERQKLGEVSISDPAIMQKAALAVCKIHDLLISKFNKEDGLGAEGKTTEEWQKEIKEKKEGDWVDKTGDWLSNAVSDVESAASSAWDWVTSWFADGGIVHASTGLKSVPKTSKPLIKSKGTDTVPAMLTPGEMVINGSQQNKLWDIITSFNPFSSPTPILSNNNLRGGISDGKLGFDPLNISINGTLKIDTGFGSVGNISGQDLLRNGEFIRQLSNEIQRYMDGMFNGGTFAGEHSKYKLDKV